LEVQPAHNWDFNGVSAYDIHIIFINSKSPVIS
jgi:hypothetical protein